MNIRQIIDNQMKWWRRENEIPLVQVYGPSATTPGARPNPAGKKVPDLSEMANDTLPVRIADYGTPFLPALGGAGYEWNGHSWWAVPSASCAADLHIKPFDDQHPLWQKYLLDFKKILDEWSWDTYLPGPAVLVGPMDVLSASLGPETLAMELYAAPDEVRRAAMEATELFNAVLDVQLEMIRAAGLRDGIADWMRIWMPGDGICYSEDFAALCGESHFREFFLEPNARIMPRLDTAFLHLHSGALPCLPAVLEMKGLKALELSNDPSGPALPQLIAAAQKVQAAGIPLQLSNWERPLPRRDVEMMLDSLDPRGLKITLQGRNDAEAWELFELVKHS